MSESRPEECSCAELGVGGVPCWACFCAGFASRPENHHTETEE